MKRYFLLAVLCFLWPLSLGAKQIFVKMSFGLHHAEQVNDVWVSKTNSFDCQSIPEEKTGLDMDISLEFVYQLNPKVGFSFGTGYFSRSFNDEGQFTALETSGFTGSFFIFPKLDSDIYFFYISSIFSFSVMPAARWNFLGGLGYYFGEIKSRKDLADPEFFRPRSPWSYFLWRYESNASTIGFHAGTGIDIDLSLNMYLSVEVLYRAINFKKFKSTILNVYSQYLALPEPPEVVGDTTFLYAKGNEDEENPGDIEYMLSDFNCSGFLLRVGLKFKF